VMAISKGKRPTLIGLPGVLVAVAMGVTVPELPPQAGRQARRGETTWTSPSTGAATVAAISHSVVSMSRTVPVRCACSVPQREPGPAQ
jgi:hypothetical protein